MTLDPLRCPSDSEETAEEYVMGRLHGAEATVFEEHLMICAGCRAAVQNADEYVRAMRVAARRLRAESARTAGS